MCREFLRIDISKQQQSSDWGADKLTDDQADYAAGDVLYLHQIRAQLDTMLKRERRQDLAAACFAFISYVSGNIIFAEYLLIPYIEGVGDVAVFCGAVIGASIGFYGLTHHQQKYLWVIQVR